MDLLSSLREQFLTALSDKNPITQPYSLYEPVDYILQLGGKRLRPLLTLMSGTMYGSMVEKCMDAALAVEVFHNFTLLHDDIMDAATVRRGQPTVHKKWDVNTGILSGDAMLIKAYQFFNSYDKDVFYDLQVLFSKTALEVCEGQQYDVDFETKDDVTVAQYLHMIKLKTSVLVGCALQMGAIIAGADKKEQQLLYDYGISLGLAFQLMDDYLDAYGDPATFGKEVGGDIRENKKTYLYLKSNENIAYTADLKKWFGIDHTTQTAAEIEAKKTAVKQSFKDSGGAAATLTAIKFYTDQALDIINKLSIAASDKKMLTTFSLNLMDRVS